MKKKYLSILSLGTICFLNSCYYDNLKELRPESALSNNSCDTSGVISYSLQIEPILSSACLGCHNPGSGDLSNHSSVQVYALSDVLYTRVNTGNMPKDGQKLSDCNIAKIKKWVDAGALNN
jgi:hypothetical protein